MGSTPSSVRSAPTSALSVRFPVPADGLIVLADMGGSFERLLEILEGHRECDMRRPKPGQRLLQRSCFGLGIQLQLVANPSAKSFFKGRTVGPLGIILLFFGSEVRLEDSGGAHGQEILIDDWIEAQEAPFDQGVDSGRQRMVWARADARRRGRVAE